MNLTENEIVEIKKQQEMLLYVQDGLSQTSCLSRH